MTEEETGSDRVAVGEGGTIEVETLGWAGMVASAEGTHHTELRIAFSTKQFWCSMVCYPICGNQGVWHRAYPAPERFMMGHWGEEPEGPQ